MKPEPDPEQGRTRKRSLIDRKVGFRTFLGALFVLVALGTTLVALLTETREPFVVRILESFLLAIVALYVVGEVGSIVWSLRSRRRPPS